MGVPFCAALLEHGKVTATDSVMNAVAVGAYSIGMLFNSGNKVLIQGFYALNDVRRSVISAIIYLSINATLSALLAPRFGVIGLGISNSVSAAMDFVVNWYFLKHVAEHRELTMDALHGSVGRGLRRQLVILGVCAFIVGLGGVALAQSLWSPGSTLWSFWGTSGRFFSSASWLLCLGVVWLISSLALVQWMGPDTLRNSLTRVRKRVLRSG